MLWTVLLPLVSCALHPWVKIDSKFEKVEFANNQVKSMFDERTAYQREAPLFLLQKSPVCEVVVQRFHFTSNTALLLNLHDQFCAGQSYTVMDNGVYLAQNFPDLPTICGVSTAFQNLQYVYSPQFMTAEYPLPAGEHQLLILVKGSKIGNGVTSMQVLLIPTGPVFGGGVGGAGPQIRICKLSREKIYVPPDFDLKSLTS